MRLMFGTGEDEDRDEQQRGKFFSHSIFLFTRQK
jgi:hypothetical protein